MTEIKYFAPETFLVGDPIDVLYRRVSVSSVARQYAHGEIFRRLLDPWWFVKPEPRTYVSVAHELSHPHLADEIERAVKKNRHAWDELLPEPVENADRSLAVCRAPCEIDPSGTLPLLDGMAWVELCALAAKSILALILALIRTIIAAVSLLATMAGSIAALIGVTMAHRHRRESDDILSSHQRRYRSSAGIAAAR